MSFYLHTYCGCPAALEHAMHPIATILYASLIRSVRDSRSPSNTIANLLQSTGRLELYGSMERAQLLIHGRFGCGGESPSCLKHLRSRPFKFGVTAFGRIIGRIYLFGQGACICDYRGPIGYTRIFALQYWSKHSHEYISFTEAGPLAKPLAWQCWARCLCSLPSAAY
jgi:hypothetical protein